MSLSQAAPTSTSRDHQLDLSDLHHINCRYARMSARRRSRVLDASSQTSYDDLRQEYNKAVEAVRFAAAHLKNEEDFDEVQSISLFGNGHNFATVDVNQLLVRLGER